MRVAGSQVWRSHPSGRMKDGKGEQQEVMRSMCFLLFSCGTLNELQLLNLDQMNRGCPHYLEWDYLLDRPCFFRWRLPSGHTSSHGLRVVPYENTSRKIVEKHIYNRENHWHLAGNRPEENSEKFILFQYLDLITHWFLKSTLWVKIGLQEDLGVECAFKTSIRLVMWWIPLVRWDYIDSSAQWVSPWVLRLDYLSSNPT